MHDVSNRRNPRCQFHQGFWLLAVVVIGATGPAASFSAEKGAGIAGDQREKGTAGGRLVSIVDHGARPGELCTAAIQAAVDRAARAGGTVYVPPGRWITGTIELKSGVTLHVDPAAALVGSGKIDDYRWHAGNTHERANHSLIFAEGVEDVTITGGGVIDGNGQAFWDPPAADSAWWIARNPRPMPMVELRRCRRVCLRDIRLQNSPGWTVHPFCCDDVVLRGVRVKNHMFGPNTDGFDINGCRDVQISNCLLACGDDAIILKATPQARSTERVAISNCICSSNCIAIGIGQETESDIRQIAVSNCICYKSHRMFAIGIWDGGTVEDVTVTGLTGDTLCDSRLARPIQMEVKQLETLPQTRPLGTIRNVNISNVVARTRGRILITAQEGATLEHISLRDVRLQYVGLEDAEALSPRDGRSGSSQYANRNPEARRQNAAVVLENVRGFDAGDLAIHWPKPAAAPAAEGKPGAERPPPYRVLWARHVQNSRLAAPMAAASSDKIDAIFAEDCPGCVFRAGP